MSQRIVGGASLAAALFVSVTLAQVALKSGPQVGENGRPMPFNPLHANGPDAGKKVCLV